MATSSDKKLNANAEYSLWNIPRETWLALSPLLALDVRALRSVAPAEDEATTKRLKSFATALDESVLREVLD